MFCSATRLRPRAEQSGEYRHLAPLRLIVCLLVMTFRRPVPPWTLPPSPPPKKKKVVLQRPRVSYIAMPHTLPVNSQPQQPPSPIPRKICSSRPSVTHTRKATWANAKVTNASDANLSEFSPKSSIARSPRPSAPNNRPTPNTPNSGDTGGSPDYIINISSDDGSQPGHASCPPRIPTTQRSRASRAN